MSRTKTLLLIAAALAATACSHTREFRYEDPITGLVDFAKPYEVIDWQTNTAMALNSGSSAPTSADLRELSSWGGAS